MTSVATAINVLVIFALYSEFAIHVRCIEAENARKIISHAHMGLNDQYTPNVPNTVTAIYAINPNQSAPPPRENYDPATQNTLVDYDVPTISPHVANTATISVLQQPMYTADQYYDYYWQAPPIGNQHNQYQLQSQPLSRVKDAAATTAIGDNGATGPVVDNNAVKISPTILLVGFTTVQRTVLEMIEQIRSMLDFVWSYFSEPGPPTLIQTARSSFDTQQIATGRSDKKETRQQHIHQHLPHLPKKRRRFRKFLVPLLLAYKLKFFTMIPMIISGLVLLTGSAGMTGFFFALFTAVLSMKHKPV